MIGPTSLILGYRERAIGTGISIVPPIGATSLGVRLVFYPRCCSSLTKLETTGHNDIEAFIGKRANVDRIIFGICGLDVFYTST